MNRADYKRFMAEFIEQHSADINRTDYIPTDR